MIKPIYVLKSEPIVDWLNQRINKKYGTVKFMAQELEVESTWLGNLVQGKYKSIEIDKADGMICRDGTCHLRDLYPELYDEI
jgi:hypothetical protein